MDDDLPFDEVGAWTKEKHERLRRYVDISRAVRRKFVDRAGATYVDLFCGRGRAIVRDTGERIDGSPLVAFKSATAKGVPFSDVHIADKTEDVCRTAELRLTRAGAAPKVEIGEAEETASRVAAKLNPRALHLVFLDPFNLDDLASK